MEQTKSTKKELTPREVFWIRFCLWTLFACVLPVVFIIYRFNLFSPNQTSFGGWGIIAIVIIAVFIISLLNYVRKGIPYSLTAQCIKGLCKIVLPLLVILLILWSLKDSINAAIQAIGCATVCEAIAVPLNPMPKWVHENLTEEQQKKVEGFSDILWDKFFTRKEKEK